MTTDTDKRRVMLEALAASLREVIEILQREEIAVPPALFLAASVVRAEIAQVYQ